jgi:hypothetical protein
MGDLAIDFCGEWHEPSMRTSSTSAARAIWKWTTILTCTDSFLQIARYDGIWWLSNVGSRLSATVADGSGGMQAWLSPGARMPLVFSHTNVIFTAGPTTYEFAVHL